jgi:hypothetical protein
VTDGKTGNLGRKILWPTTNSVVFKQFASIKSSTDVFDQLLSFSKVTKGSTV